MSDYKQALEKLYPPKNGFLRLFKQDTHLSLPNLTKAQKIRNHFDLLDPQANIFICWCLVWAATYQD